MTRRSVIIALTVVALLALTTSPALASHDHFMATPNDKCHQVAPGQTRIPNGENGGHKYHWNVHKGAALDGTLGNSEVGVFLEGC